MLFVHMITARPFCFSKKRFLLGKSIKDGQINVKASCLETENFLTLFI